ncbi:MAG: hypothetical protein FWF51_02015 [Chitinivibrionia bacterium]|nr:hypothetical protein [Chitinivibrionia bacterium]
MRKILAILLCVFAVSLAEEKAIFVGAWCVENDDMKIEFIGKDSVAFSSDGDASVNGNGKFSFDDELLSAELSNSGMKMKIVYKYKQTKNGVSVITQSLEVNGDAINVNPEPISLVRCKK